MVSAQQIREKLADWLVGSISLRDFHVWFANATWDMHNAGDQDARTLVAQIDLSLSEYTGGHLSFDALREELAEAIRPFVETRRLSWPAEVLYDAGTSVAAVKQLTLLPRGRLVEVRDSFFGRIGVSKPLEGKKSVAIVFPPAHSPSARVVAPPSHLVLRA